MSGHPPWANPPYPDRPPRWFDRVLIGMIERMRGKAVRRLEPRHRDVLAKALERAWVSGKPFRSHPTPHVDYTEFADALIAELAKMAEMEDR